MKVIPSLHRSISCVALFPVLLFCGVLAGCRAVSPPEDPIERLRWVQERVERQPYGVKCNMWLAHLVRYPSPEARDYLFDLLDDPRFVLWEGVLYILSREQWIADQETRARLIFLYQDVNSSMHIRARIGQLVMVPWKTAYPELAGFPDKPQPPQGSPIMTHQTWDS